MDLVVLLMGIGVVISYRQSDNRNRLVLFLGIVLVIIGLIPFTLGFIDGFKKGFHNGVEEAMERAGYHPPVVAQTLSAEETSNIIASLSKCWEVTKKDRGLPIVKLHVLLNPDASIKTMGVINAEKARYRDDAVYRETADRAMRSLKACSPLTFLPQGKYDLWKEIELTFDPHPAPQSPEGK